jgi:hypothetical protein
MADPVPGVTRVDEREDGAGRVTDPALTQDALGGGVSEPAGRFRSAIRREAAAISVVTPPVDPRAEIYRGFGDGLSRAFELAVTPAIFGAGGYALDRWLGIVPVFTTIFVLLAVIGLLLRVWYGYVYRMQALEASGPWANRGGSHD